MGFLKFCCIKLLKAILFLICVVLLIIGANYIPDWMWGIVIFLAIASIFLRCWWVEYQLKRK